MQERKGVVHVEEGNTRLCLEIYEGRVETEFYTLLTVTKDDSVSNFRLFKGLWVPTERKREAAHLEALWQEFYRQART